jgi:hypothetical protein
VPIIRIPDRYRAGFERIKQLSATDIEALVNALKRVPISGGIKDLTSSVQEQVTTLSADDAEAIVRSLYSLYVFRIDSDTPLSEVISELTSAMRATDKPSLTLSEDDRVQFEKNMSALLNIDTMALTTKVGQIKIEYENTFHDARILSDIRPIFRKPDEQPVGGAITHTLKIEYHHEGEHKEFYVALDSEDLQKMKAVLQRADAKAASLRLFLKSTGIADFS